MEKIELLVMLEARLLAEKLMHKQAHPGKAQLRELNVDIAVLTVACVSPDLEAYKHTMLTQGPSDAEHLRMITKGYTIEMVRAGVVRLLGPLNESVNQKGEPHE